MELSLIIPAFNEENRITSTLKQYINFLEKSKIKYEIIVVFDGSDNTPIKVKPFLNRKIKLITYKKRQGKGRAIKLGFKKAKYSNLAFVDADNSIPPKEFKKLLTHIGESDVIIASRSLSDSKIIPRKSLFRKLITFNFNLFRKILFPSIKVNDTQCGAKLFNKKSSKLFNKLKTNGWLFDLEIMYKAESIKEVPINWYQKSGSQVKLTEPITLFFSLIKLRLKLRQRL